MHCPGSDTHPTVSIIMPVQRHRGRLLAAIDRWSAQDYPRERLELVFASTTWEPQIDAQVKARLAQPDTPRGSIVFIKTANEMAQYAYAARYALGQWLLFTEPHCLPEPDCVRELIGALRAQGMHGGCVRTLSDGSTNRAAQIEERIYMEDAAVWSQAGDWRKFTKRGFALRRDVYRAIGGFEAEYGWFSELIIAARLDAEGYRIGYVPTAAVQHFNATNMQEMFDYVHEYRLQQARYMHEGSPRLRPYFAEMSAPAEVPPPQVARAQAQAVRAALADALGHLPARWARQLASATCRAAIAAACGPRAVLALRYWLARAKFTCLSLSQEQAYRNYVVAAERLGEWAEASYRAAPTSTAARHEGDKHDASFFPGELRQGIYGFYASERYRGRAFRWTSPVASLVLDLPAGNFDLSLDTSGLCPPERKILAFWNGRRLSRSTNSPHAWRVKAEDFAEQQLQVLTLITSPLASSDCRETRALGLPLFGVHAAAQQQAGQRKAA
jgi:GT2 family glycosyltransferase